VICCAPEDVAELAAVIRELEGQKRVVEVVSDVGTDPKALEPVLGRLEGAGLYVLCRSDGLPRDAIDRLREVLLAHRVPFGRTLTVASIRPSELLERIGAAARRLHAAQPGASAVARPARPTMLGVPLPKPPAPMPDISAIPATVAPDDSVPTDVGSGHEDTVTDQPASGEDTVATTAPSADASESKPAGAIAFDELTTIEVPHALVEEEERAHMKRAGQAARAARRPPPPPPRPAAPEDSLANAPLITAEDLADLATDSGPISLLSSESVEKTQPTPFAAVSKVLITGDTAIARLVGDTGHTPPASLSTASVTKTLPTPVIPQQPVEADSSPSPTPPGAATSSPAKTSSRKPMGLWLGVGALGLAAVVTTGWAISKAGESSSQSASVDRSKETEAPAKDVAPEPVEPEEPEPDATLPGQLDTLVMAALRKREVRALDVLLVAKDEGPNLEYADAEAYCRMLAVAGIEQWRLPEVGELASMTDAGMVGSAIYWSSTPADTFGDTRLAWNGRLKRILPRDAASHALCVRGEHAAR
jgi:hypothetical protein